MRRVGLLVLPVLAAAGGFVAWSALSRPKDAYLTRDVADGFDLAAAPAARPAAAGPAAPLLAPESPRPVPGSGLGTAAEPSRAAPGGPGPGAQAGGAAPKKTGPLKPGAEGWALGQPLVRALLAAPARVLLQRSALASAGELKGFLASPSQVDRFLDSPLTRVVLNSPTVATALLGDPKLFAAVLESPALKDPQAAKALAQSPMLRKMLDCDGVTQALQAPSVRERLEDPATAAWLAERPELLAAVMNAASR